MGTRFEIYRAGHNFTDGSGPTVCYSLEDAEARASDLLSHNVEAHGFFVIIVRDNTLFGVRTHDSYKTFEVI